MTSGMRTGVRVGGKGQVVIPKQVREGSGTREGAEVTVELGDGEVVSEIRRVRASGWGKPRT